MLCSHATDDTLRPTVTSLLMGVGMPGGCEAAVDSTRGFVPLGSGVGEV